MNPPAAVFRLFKRHVRPAVLVLALSLCPATAGAGDLPSAFSRTWCTFSTDHFELITDLPKHQATAKIERLDRFRQMFLVLFAEAQDRSWVPLQMLGFRRAKDFKELTDAQHYSGITIPSLHRYRLLFGPEQRRGVRDTDLHEYAHYLVRSQTQQNYPLWYDEGLASYLSAVNLRRDQPVLGYLDRKIRFAKTLGRGISYEEVLQATDFVGWSKKKVAAFYEKSWLLVHFIRLGHQAKGFPDLRASAAAYLSQPRRDFAATFQPSTSHIARLWPEANPSRPAQAKPGSPDNLTAQSRKMQSLLDDYRGSVYIGESARLPDSNLGAIERRCLDERQSRLVLARSIARLNPTLAIKVLEDADGERSAEEMTTLALALADLDQNRAMTAVAKALQLDPNHADAIVQLANLKTRNCTLSSDPACLALWGEATDLFRRALALNPERHDAAFGLGVAYLHAGRAPDALHYLRVAHGKMPWSVQTNFYLGEAYRIIGDEHAAIHLRKARNWALEPAWIVLTETALARLQE